jgi:hypothetical protein
MRNDPTHYAAYWAGLAVLAVASVFAISPHSLLTLLATALCVMPVARLVLGAAGVLPAMKALTVYVLAVAVIYTVQLATLPEYYGFSGGLGIGTDDSYFFSLGSPDLPANFPTREGFFLRSDPYGSLLRVFGEVVFDAFGSVHPLDLLIINVSLLTLLPSLVAGITERLTPGDTASRTAWWLTIACPFIAANGAILVRDGLITTAFAGAVLAVLQRRVVLVAFWVAFAGYLRLQHGLMLMGVIWLVWTASAVTWNDTRYQTRRGGAVLLAIWITPPVIALLAGALLLGERIVTLIAANPLVRQEFFQTFIIEGVARDSGTSTFYQLNQLPWPLRLPMAFGFYFVSPLADVGRLVESPIFIVRDYMLALFGLFMIAYSAFFIKAGTQAVREMRWTLIALIVAFCICLLLVSQASMQLRHKLPLMALFYPVVAIGVASISTRVIQITALLAATGLGCLQIVFNGYKLL